MDKSSKPKFLDTLSAYYREKKIPERVFKTLSFFYGNYKECTSQDIDPFFLTYLEKISEQCVDPYQFEDYHHQIREPFDHYRLGLDFLRPLVDIDHSTVTGKTQLREIVAHIKEGHNVIFLANHQTEADPQAISLLLESEFPSLASGMIFVAGERVITDPFAIPVSMGCNLLCIYSKRYIDHPPEKKQEKQLHNKRAMNVLSKLLAEGGKSIYIAPSGGRDRRNDEGEIEIAQFDPQSIEMVYLMAKKAKTPTFFYPMALGTYEILPPPETVQVELGEERFAKRGSIHLSIGPAIDMEHFPGSENKEKLLRRKCRADYIWKLVDHDYHQFPKEKP